MLEFGDLFQIFTLFLRDDNQVDGLFPARNQLFASRWPCRMRVPDAKQGDGPELTPFLKCSLYL